MVPGVGVWVKKETNDSTNNNNNPTAWFSIQGLNAFTQVHIHTQLA